MTGRCAREVSVPARLAETLSLSGARLLNTCRGILSFARRGQDWLLALTDDVLWQLLLEIEMLNSKPLQQFWGKKSVEGAIESSRISERRSCN